MADRMDGRFSLSFIVNVPLLYRLYYEYSNFNALQPQLISNLDLKSSLIFNSQPEFSGDVQSHSVLKATMVSAKIIVSGLTLLRLL